MAVEPLAAAFMARRPEAFEQVYTRNAVELVSVARYILGDAGTAEDCVHDVLLRVWRTPQSYRAERGSLRSFLLACVRNEALSQRRSLARRQERERMVSEGAPLEYVDEPMLDRADAERVRVALEQLPAEQRLTIELAYYGGRSQREIAAQLGVPLGTVKSRVTLALKKLGSQLGGAEVT
jgi:RNA polymerase sigma factor (sigma-70 family)